MNQIQIFICSIIMLVMLLIICSNNKKERLRRKHQYERNKLTKSLRYDVLYRDKFKCVSCGRSARDGVKLEVDHIRPISKGGKTVMKNLQTLCFDCNRGKRDKWGKPKKKKKRKYRKRRCWR